MALLSVAIFTLQELARAARSAEKLLDTLNRELPATLQDLRVTGKELSGLSDEVSGSVQSARSVVQQVDKSLSDAKVHAQKAQITTRSLFAGASAALKVLAGKPRRRRRPPTRRPPAAPIHSSKSNLSPAPGNPSSKPQQQNQQPVQRTAPTAPEVAISETATVNPSNPKEISESAVSEDAVSENV